MLFIPHKIENTHNIEILTVQEGENLYTYDEFYTMANYKTFEILHEAENLIVVKNLNRQLVDHNFNLIQHIPVGVVASTYKDDYTIVFIPKPLGSYNTLCDIFTLDTLVSIKNTGESLNLLEFRRRCQSRYVPVRLSSDEIVLTEID